MPLTRPRFSQFDTTISSISDPITVLNKSSTLANIDVGFIINRNGGALANTAIFWNELANTFALVFTTSTGELPNANIAISTYANLIVNTLNTTFLNATGNILGSSITSTGSTFVGELFVTGRSGDEGGQLNLAPAVTNNSLSGNITIDIFQNRLRIFESGGTNRGGYFDLTGLSASVGTNLAGGGGGTPGGGGGQIQFNSGSSTFAGAASLYYFGANGAIVANAGIASTSTSTGTMQITGGIGVSGNVWADQIYAVNNGNGQNIRIGDDAWLGDVNVANTVRLMGAQDNTQAYLRFGNTNTSTLGVSGSGPLTWGGVLNVTGNILGATGTLSALNVNGFINTSANISGAVVNAGALNATGTTTLVAVNSTGFINTSANVSASVVRAGATTTSTTNATGALLVAGGTGIVGNLNVGDGTLQGGTHVFQGNINPFSSNTYTLGTTTLRWNRVWGVSVNAQYADLAEIYSSDQQYPAGTVVVFDGEFEVTQSHSPHDTRIAGVISTDPAYLMNGSALGVPVALQGRVPCRVLGPVSKGDRVVSSHIPGVAQALDPLQYQPGCIIGKALQAIDSADISIIEVVVGRL